MGTAGCAGWQCPSASTSPTVCCMWGEAHATKEGHTFGAVLRHLGRVAVLYLHRVGAVVRECRAPVARELEPQPRPVQRAPGGRGGARAQVRLRPAEGRHLDATHVVAARHAGVGRRAELLAQPLGTRAVAAGVPAGGRRTMTRACGDEPRKLGAQRAVWARHAHCGARAPRDVCAAGWRANSPGSRGHASVRLA